MPELKELAIYGVLALIVVLIVVYVLTSGILKSSYNVSIKLSQIGASQKYPYQTSNYSINITNKGHNQVNNLHIVFYLDGVQQSTTSVSIPSQQSVVLFKNYTYVNPGMYNFQAVADPGHVLNIENRNLSQSTITVNVAQASLPNVYTSIPNANITGTQSFTFTGRGGIGSAAIAQRYDIGVVNKLFGSGENISIKIFENVYPFTANVYGAYAKYNDNSTAYTAWLQGTVNPQVVEVVISSFGLNVNKLNTTMGQIGYAVVNGTTSICTFYKDGWTKIISYYNDSNPYNCVAIAANTYSANESVTLINLVRGNKNLTHYQSGFFYTNSSVMGSALLYSNYNLTATNIFQNNYGIFVASVKRLGSSINVSVKSNSTCYGLIFNSNNVHVCSYVILTRTANYSLPFGLINSSYITNDYMINIYSLVNTTQLVAAHSNAAHLITALGINESSVTWVGLYKDSCAFENTSIGCTFKNFLRSNNTAYFNITNKLPYSIRINTLNCELLPGFKNVSVNTTILAYSSKEFVQKCNVAAVPMSSLVTTFTLIANYTYNNSTRIVNGTFNLTNQVSN